jgi:hypothetical protein
VTARRLPPLDERGLSVLELTVTSAIIATVMAIAFGLLTSLFGVVAGQQERTDAGDEVRSAFGQLEHDLRSASALGPATDSGMQVRLRTTLAGTDTCVAFRVAGGQLQRQTKAPADASWPDSWRTLVDGVTNAGPPETAAFAVMDDRLTVALVVAPPKAPSAVQRFDTEVTGRNIRYGVPESACTA